MNSFAKSLPPDAGIIDEFEWHKVVACGQNGERQIFIDVHCAPETGLPPFIVGITQRPEAGVRTGLQITAPPDSNPTPDQEFRMIGLAGHFWSVACDFDRFEAGRELDQSLQRPPERGTLRLMRHNQRVAARIAVAHFFHE